MLLFHAVLHFTIFVCSTVYCKLFTSRLMISGIVVVPVSINLTQSHNRINDVFKNPIKDVSEN